MAYDAQKIEELLRQHELLPNKDKWEVIGAEFHRSGSAAHRWYYRWLAEQKKKREQEQETKLDIPTDVIRTVYLLLIGKACRIGYFQAIAEIQEFLEKL